MEKINPAYEIERLLQFGQKSRFLGQWDVIAARNALLDLLQVTEPYEGHVEDECQDSPVEILEKLLDYAAEAGILEENTVTYRDLLDARIMGLLMPRPSEVIRQFWSTAKEDSIQKATDEYYTFSQKSNYIRMDRIAKNLYWLTSTEYGELEITVNLSKPEKDPKAIAAAKLMKQTNYPKCLLCLENVGYSGRVNHPARQNHRVIPMTLDAQPWYLQYSPYVYYNEHCIVFSEDHTPMKISEKTFRRTLEFVEQIPHYFIGSNADLPIVGGSILTHDHFQGGHHKFPMELATVEKVFYHENYPGINIGIVKWPMSVIRISGKEKELLIKLAMYILNTWKEYSDTKADILAFSEQGDEKIPHNTVTPIARRNTTGDYEFDLVLRNNRTTEEHPDGIFHPHKELHHIKKENIGLIEVMGLAVLPGRLTEETKRVKEILTGRAAYEEGKLGEDEMLAQHLPWIQSLVKKYGTALYEEAAQEILQQQVGQIFMKVLEDAGVYKRDEKGCLAFGTFMHHAGFYIK